MCAQGYQSMAQACGLLQLREARDAWLTSLCAFTLSDAAGEADNILVSTRGEGLASPTGAPVNRALHSGRLQSRNRGQAVLQISSSACLVELESHVPWFVGSLRCHNVTVSADRLR